MKKYLDKYPVGVYSVVVIQIPLQGICVTEKGKMSSSLAERHGKDRKMTEGNTTKNDCNIPDGGENCCGCHRKATPRTEKELKLLKNRLNRITGQLNGIGKMLEENRYCGDILTQLAAAESALQSFGYLILQEHMESCVVEEIGKGNLAVVGEAVALMKKLK